MTGISDLKLHGLRLSALRAEGRTPAGTSVGLRLRVSPRGAFRDPWVVHAVEVAKQWALSALAALPGRGPMKACWEAGKDLLGQAKPWAHCVDPGQVVQLCMARIGIRMPDAFALSFQGLTFSMLEFSPGFICARVKEAAVLASDVGALGRLPGAWSSALHWGPLEHLLHKKESDVWTKHHKAIIRSLVGGLFWPQARLYKRGKAQHGRCLLCGGPGTLYHRFYECPCIEAHRRDECPKHVREAAARMQAAGDIQSDLFCRGLFPSAARCFPVPEARVDDQLIWIGVPAGWKFSGAVFVDGSAFHSRFSGLSRAGWAIIQIDRAGILVGGVFGVVPRSYAPNQEARDGEDRAFQVLAEYSEWNSEDPLTVYSDCAGSISCAKDPGVALDPMNARSHFWVGWWEGIGCLARVHKVKAHSALASAANDHEELLF